MLRTLLTDIKAWLEADTEDWFDDITIVVATKGKLQSEIDTAIGKIGRVSAGKKPLCITIEAVSGTLGHVGGTLRTEPIIHLTIFENVLLNRKGDDYKTAEDVMERAAWMLRGGQATQPPVYAQKWSLLDDSNEELTYGIDATTRGTVVVEVDP
jgi:hypothetical protein